MEPHEVLALEIARDDLRYAAGTTLTARQPIHPKLWPFFQWGVTTAFEGQKHLADAHGLELELRWDSSVAKAARHSSKFFDDSGLLLGGVLDRFKALIDANRSAFFPANRLRVLDGLRADLSVITSGREVVLTNISGLFMMGIPIGTASDYKAVGALGYELAVGLGQAASKFTHETELELKTHGNKDLPAAQWSDAKSFQALPATYGGELPAEVAVAVAVMTVHSAVQSSLLWAHADCCSACERAARKHRFVVLYQALRSVEILSGSALANGPVARTRCAQLMDPAGNAPIVLSTPFRRLRNGWLHLGISDVAERLPIEPNADDLVLAYTEIDTVGLDQIVETGLNHFAQVSNAWMLDPGADGSTLFDHLKAT